MSVTSELAERPGPVSPAEQPAGPAGPAGTARGAGGGRAEPPAGERPVRRPVRGWLSRKTVSITMNALIVAAVVAAALTTGWGAHRAGPPDGSLGSWALRLFALWCLSFLPGWLYVRFLDVRARALWNEYVLNLHRLGWDKPGYLPRPPASSAFFAAWHQDRVAGCRSDNIYRQKFEAYYGRQLSRDDDLDERRDGAAALRRGAGASGGPSAESLFPLFLATAVFAAGWAAVLWDTRFLTAPAGAGDVLKYAFLGSYAFVASMLIRRYFQSDLRPSAYASAVYRIAFVLLIVATAHQVMQPEPVLGRAEIATVFIVGFFPLAALQALQHVAARTLSVALPSLSSDYPLDQIDGFNVWYQARLAEEGVEDMQNLTTMNLVDVILHTRVPAGRLVDWVDQAFLLTHLEDAAGAGPEADGGGGGTAVGGEAARRRLRRVGIRTATGLLKAFSDPAPAPACGGAPGRVFALPEGVTPPLPEGQLRLLVKVLAQEPGLNPVWNWQRNGVHAHRD
jgi:hypothetical protein